MRARRNPAPIERLRLQSANAGIPSMRRRSSFPFAFRPARLAGDYLRFGRRTNLLKGHLFGGRAHSGLPRVMAGFGRAPQSEMNTVGFAASGITSDGRFRSSL